MKSFWIDGDTMGLVAREVPEPELRPETLLVRMRAVALNRGEFIAGHGLHAPGSMKPAGYEGAGEVVAVAEGVASFRVGDRVFGRADAAFGEVARMHTNETALVPAGMDWTSAAGASITYVTASEALFSEGDCRPGDWAVVTGASSGVGVACVQLGKAHGFHTFGITGSMAKLERLKALGMSAGVVTRQPNFAAAVRALTGGEGAKVAVNNSGGVLLSESLRALRYRGVQAIVGYVDNDVHPRFDLIEAHVNRLRVVGVSFKRRSMAERAEAWRGFERHVLPHLASGAIRPPVDRVFAFDELPAARKYMESDQHIGKIVAVL